MARGFSDASRPAFSYVHIERLLVDQFNGKSITETDGMCWYDVRSVIREALLAWLGCWSRLTDIFRSQLAATFIKAGTPVVWAFGDPAMEQLARVIGAGSLSLGWWFLWPCGSACSGQLVGCPNAAGHAPDVVPTT